MEVLFIIAAFLVGGSPGEQNVGGEGKIFNVEERV